MEKKKYLANFISFLFILIAEQLYKNILSSFLFFFGITSVLSQVTKDTIAISEIILEASPIKNVLQNAASAVTVITTADINKTQGIILTPVLNTIPGVYMQQGNWNTNRITIRGIGARSQYGTNKVKAYFNAIPLSSGEGETVIEDIDPASIDKIEIIKGPNSTSFGSGLGGVIHLFPKKTALFESFGKSETTFGSFDLIQQRFSCGYSDKKSNLYTSYSDLQSEGFRDNSSYRRKTFNLHANQEIGTKGNLYFLGNFIRLKSYIPSSLNEKDFNTNPEKAAPTWAASQGYESYDKFLFGLGYDHQFSKKWSLKSSVFSNIKDTYEARPFDILDEQSNSIGFRWNLNYKDQLYSLPMELSIGTEMAAEQYQYSLYKNLYLSQPGQGSIEGNQFSEIKQDRNYANYFLQMEIWLSSKLHLEMGMALNTTKYTLEDVFQNAANSQKQAYSFGTIGSPRIGLSYKVAKGKNIYASISKGFSVPAVAETLTPTGQINTDLQPEIGWNYELGFKGNWFNNKLYSELTFFSIQIENLLVAQRTGNDQYVGVNAGSSSHPGLEILLNYKIQMGTNFQIAPYFSGAINKFTFKDFVNAGADYSGNQLTGVPDQQLNYGLDVNYNKGFSLNISCLTIGKIPMNDANTKYSEAYSLLNIKTAYVFNLLKVLKTELRAGVNNVLNEKYAASILPNAVGIGTGLPRYYYPGNPINYYGGISVAYIF